MQVLARVREAKNDSSGRILKLAAVDAAAQAMAGKLRTIHQGEY